MNMMEYMKRIIKTIEVKIKNANYTSEQHFLDMIDGDVKCEISYLMGQRAVLDIVAQVAPIMFTIEEEEE